MEGVNELKYRKDVTQDQTAAYLKTVPEQLKHTGISYIDDLTGKTFTNVQLTSGNEDWIRQPSRGEPPGLYVKPDPNDPEHFGDPTAYGFINNKSYDGSSNRTQVSIMIEQNGRTNNSQGLYGIYGMFGDENYYEWTYSGGDTMWKFKFNDVSDMNLTIGLMPEGHPKRWTPSNDGRDEIYDIILSGNSFKITPKGFRKIKDRFYSPIATLLSTKTHNPFNNKYKTNVNYEQLYLKYKSKYLNLKKQLNH